MNDPNPPNRCRLVLIAAAETAAGALLEAIEGGEVASIILPQGDRDEASFQAFAEQVVPVAQAAGIAVMIAGDSRTAGRVGADGLHLDANKAELAEAIARQQGRMMVGVNGGKSRDEALELGEERPDYIFFGRFGYDNKPEPHARNLTMATWWAELIEVPCMVLGGSDIASCVTVAQTGADFVALSAAVFSATTGSRQAVAEANALLDGHAPRFEA